jgi:probable rRNA maturation factor
VISLLPVGVLARTAADALSAAGAPSPASLTLVLSDDDELTSLNAEHMGHEGPTDVLSFPLYPPSAFPMHAGKTSDKLDGRPIEPAYRPATRRRTHLGDIVISVERAIAQATSSPADEMRQLVIHGVLHVCGWDHAHDEEREAMRSMEREILRLK